MKFSVSFRKIWKSIEILEKLFWTNFVKNNFFWKIVGECSKYFRFCHLINYLLTGWLVSHLEILIPRFYTRTLQTRSVLPDLELSIFGTRWINSKYQVLEILPNFAHPFSVCLNVLNASNRFEIWNLQFKGTKTLMVMLWALLEAQHSLISRLNNIERPVKQRVNTKMDRQSFAGP